MMGVATSADGTREMLLANGNAYDLLDALGAPRDACGELDLSDLVDAIADPATRRHLERQGMGTYLAQLEVMATAPSAEGKRLVWA